eukprot:scaffold491295_cov16-Prasinocladus_malaysianus.AAC.1
MTHVATRPSDYEAPSHKTQYYESAGLCCRAKLIRVENAPGNSYLLHLQITYVAVGYDVCQCD